MQTKYKLYHIVQSLGVPPARLHDHAKFGKDLGLDSLEVAELLGQVELRFEVSIPARDYARVQSIAALATYLAARLGQGSKAPAASASQLVPGGPAQEQPGLDWSALKT
jgi:acyl carrier protein